MQNKKVYKKGKDMKNRTKELMGLTILMGFMLCAMPARAIQYTGSLSYPTGIYATEEWRNSATSIIWTVSEAGIKDGSILWDYHYIFSVPSKDISHLSF